MAEERHLETSRFSELAGQTRSIGGDDLGLNFPVKINSDQLEYNYGEDNFVDSIPDIPSLDDSKLEYRIEKSKYSDLLGQANILIARDDLLGAHSILSKILKEESNLVPAYLSLIDVLDKLEFSQKSTEIKLHLIRLGYKFNTDYLFELADNILIAQNKSPEALEIANLLYKKGLYGNNSCITNAQHYLNFILENFSNNSSRISTAQHLLIISKLNHISDMLEDRNIDENDRHKNRSAITEEIYNSLGINIENILLQYYCEGKTAFCLQIFRILANHHCNIIADSLLNIMVEILLSFYKPYIAFEYFLMLRPIGFYGLFSPQASDAILNDDEINLPPLSCLPVTEIQKRLNVLQNSKTKFKVQLHKNLHIDLKLKFLRITIQLKIDSLIEDLMMQFNNMNFEKYNDLIILIGQDLINFGFYSLAKDWINSFLEEEKCIENPKHHTLLRLLFSTYLNLSNFVQVYLLRDMVFDNCPDYDLNLLDVYFEKIPITSEYSCGEEFYLNHTKSIRRAIQNFDQKNVNLVVRRFLMLIQKFEKSYLNRLSESDSSSTNHNNLLLMKNLAECINCMCFSRQIQLDDHFQDKHSFKLSRLKFSARQESLLELYKIDLNMTSIYNPKIWHQVQLNFEDFYKDLTFPSIISYAKKLYRLLGMNKCFIDQFKLIASMLLCPEIVSPISEEIDSFTSPTERQINFLFMIACMKIGARELYRERLKIFFPKDSSELRRLIYWNHKRQFSHRINEINPSMSVPISSRMENTIHNIEHFGTGLIFAIYDASIHMNKRQYSVAKYKLLKILQKYEQDCEFREVCPYIFLILSFCYANLSKDTKKQNLKAAERTMQLSKFGIIFFEGYVKKRKQNLKFEQEILFNLGRFYQSFNMTAIARSYYKKGLKTIPFSEYHDLKSHLNFNLWYTCQNEGVSGITRLVDKKRLDKLF
ncbi:MAG: hypothetical protein MHMPM18_000819 [Marteilia pararefringens]